MLDFVRIKLDNHGHVLVQAGAGVDLGRGLRLMERVGGIGAVENKS